MSTTLEQSYPFTMKAVAISQDIEIAYMEEGEGPYTLLFIHGLGSYAPAWNKNLAELSKHYRCIAMDLPNSGQSKKGRYDFSMSFFAATVEAFIKRLELKNVILVGHSMGGQISMTIALRKQILVEKLILVAPAGFETFSELDRLWFQQTLSPEAVRATSNEMIMENLEWNFAPKKLPGDATFMYGDRIRLKQDPDEYTLYSEMIPKSVLGMLNEPVFYRLTQIKQPTLIFFGNQDYFIPNRMLHPMLATQFIAQTGQQQIPNSRLLMYSPCGHFLQWECDERVNAAILEFLEP